MAPRRTKLVQNDYKKLTEEDVICPICGTVLIEPITLPCRHGFCSSCFEAATENANVVCPQCRVRVGSFLRSATKSNKLINEALWRAIQDAFPLQVKNKQAEIGRNYGGTCKMKPGNEKHGRVDDVKKNVLQKIKANNVSTDKSNKRPNFVNNLATKEYTCRVLCQNAKETKPLFKESQVALQKKNKRIQEIKQSEMSADDRSNSIESECLYFKPIDYRHNPPSEGLAPIKVPTRKPNVSPHPKILAPSGQKQINMHHLESAFARLCSLPSEKRTKCKKENVEVQIEEEESITPMKRKRDKAENKAKKKAKVAPTSTNNQLSKSKESVAVSNVCDSRRCKAADVDVSIGSVSTIKKVNFKQQNLNEQFKKAVQEKADFELATKLQQTFNQSYKYSTRSAIRMATAANPVKIGNMMTSYKVN